MGNFSFLATLVTELESYLRSNFCDRWVSGLLPYGHAQDRHYSPYTMSLTDFCYTINSVTWYVNLCIIFCLGDRIYCPFEVPYCPIQKGKGIPSSLAFPLREKASDLFGGGHEVGGREVGGHKVCVMLNIFKCFSLRTEVALVHCRIAQHLFDFLKSILPIFFTLKVRQN